MDVMEKVYRLYDSGIKTERLHLISGESINISIKAVDKVDSLLKYCFNFFKSLSEPYTKNLTLIFLNIKY